MFAKKKNFEFIFIDVGPSMNVLKAYTRLIAIYNCNGNNIRSL